VETFLKFVLLFLSRLPSLDERDLGVKKSIRIRSSFTHSQ